MLQAVAVGEGLERPVREVSCGRGVGAGLGGLAQGVGREADGMAVRVGRGPQVAKVAVAVGRGPVDERRLGLLRGEQAALVVLVGQNGGAGGDRVHLAVGVVRGGHVHDGTRVVHLDDSIANVIRVRDLGRARYTATCGGAGLGVGRPAFRVPGHVASRVIGVDRGIGLGLLAHAQPQLLVVHVLPGQ